MTNIAKPLAVGLIGCGNISDIYLTNAALFKDIKMVACADLNSAAAERQAARYGLNARATQQLLASDDVDIILNLTVPAAHAEVSLAALAAGKHVYCEKPLATTIADGAAIVAAAHKNGLRVGCAPDTVLGASIQAAREMVDANALGKVLSGVTAVLSHGMEHWHPNPGFFFQPGGGPVFDMGPYYLTTLVTLLGPVATVMANGQIGFAQRTISAPNSPQRGQTIKVETLTNVQALLEFQSGAQITFLASWDVWKHGMLPIELHGEAGSLRVPDPNWFGGVVQLSKGRSKWRHVKTDGQFFGRANHPKAAPVHANYRGLGLADMAQAIRHKRPHRANGDVGLHVLAIMAGILEAATQGRKVSIQHSCLRPEALAQTESQSLLA